MEAVVEVYLHCPKHKFHLNIFLTFHTTSLSSSTLSTLPTDRLQCAPRFVIRPQNAFTYEGQSVKFNCRIVAVAAPTVCWFHNNMELRQSVKYMKRYSGEDYSFVINRAKLDDRGEYIIRAENHYGAREEPVFLNVQREYYFHILNFFPSSHACF